ncbi:hypothetical protein DSM100238_1130 [Bifidobacterium apri]|uniref:Uncharacterized protein n=1 Tax=Bifidobacterium apri TaxID=1769423 RepID=A0A6A2W3B4_9BIFI|nr:hypothetical protein DSM100238_1130 [Bifidobacterium apri]
MTRTLRYRHMDGLGKNPHSQYSQGIVTCDVIDSNPLNQVPFAASGNNQT